MSFAQASRNRISAKAASFTESVIREMSREAVKYGAVSVYTTLSGSIDCVEISLYYTKVDDCYITRRDAILQQPIQEKIESKEFMGYAFISAFRGVYGAL